MKKFLTVLLVIAVMFTFSFGSAFAAEAVTPSVTKTHDEAMAEAVAAINKAFDSKAAAAKALLAEEYSVTEVSVSSYVPAIVDGSVYAATIDEIVKDYKAALAVAAQKVSAANPTVNNVDTLVSAICGTTVEDVLFYANTTDLDLVINDLYVCDAETLRNYVVANNVSSNTVQQYYQVFTYVNAVAGLKADLQAELAKVDMAQYTNDVMDKEDPYKTTYAQAAAKELARLEKVIADTTVSMTQDNATALNKLIAMFNEIHNGIRVTDSYTLIDNTVVVTEYKLAKSNLKTAEELGYTAVAKDAQKAAQKAQVQTTVATWTQWALGQYQAVLTSNATAAEKAAAKELYEARLEMYADYATVNNLLIDEEETQVTSEYVAAQRVDYYEAAEKVAALCKIQVEKEGSAKYDAAEIDKILAELKVEIFAGRTTEVTAYDFRDALIKADRFEFNKANVICDVEDAMEAELYDACGDAVYYAPEQAKVEAKYAELIAKVEAAANQDQLDAIDLTVTHTIKNKTAVRNDIAGYTNTTKFVNAVNQYIGYLNYAANAQNYSDAYRATITDTTAVVKYLAGEGARTNADVAGFLAQAEAYAQTVKTNGELKAAKAAANEAIKALPNRITLADKEAVKAADDLAYAAGVTSTKLEAAIEAVRLAEVKAIDDMIKALPKTLTAADDAAVKAIYNAIYAYEDECLYEDHNGTGVAAAYTAAGKAATAVREAWLKDVHTAIDAVDAEDEASVEAARAAVDAYVARYTSVCGDVNAIEHIKNIDKLTYAEAQVALAKIEAVEALKITAGSTAKKGAITVKWTVKGDTSAVEGYEIWKSTKKNSGFKKAFTTTKMSYKNTKGLKKGTKYFYKVRAIAYVGAEKITSDWSNKAYRVAK